MVVDTVITELKMSLSATKMFKEKYLQYLNTTREKILYTVTYDAIIFNTKRY